MHSNIGGGYPEHVLSDATIFWMASRVTPLLELDSRYLCAQADRRRPYATGKLETSLTWFYRVTTGRFVRPVCQTDASERVHESAFMRLNETNGPPDPTPYGDTAHRKRLQGLQNRVVPLSDFEKHLLAEIPDTAPEKIMQRARRPLTFCDGLVMVLGGYRP